jgi:pimeloyl-ACP methyl ester carboxylesterase
MSLRGQGASTRPDPFAGRSADYDVDTFADEDLPAALDEVRAVTGAGAVDFIGHSLGGIVYYAWLARTRSAALLGRAVTLGSPAVFRWGGLGERVARAILPLGGLLPALPLEAATLLTLPIHGAWDGPIERALISFDNVDPEVWRRFIAVGADGISGGVLKQASRFVESGRLVSRDGAIDYVVRLGSARTPTLFVAGRGDNMVPAAMVRAAYDAFGGEKAYRVIGRADGARADYAHMDLLLGERAAEEVWGPLLAWLNAPAGAPPGTR